MRPLIIKVIGSASGKTLGEFKVTRPAASLMAMLQSQGVPIASSCSGEGICQKCVVNGQILSCQIKASEWPSDKAVVISYL